MTTSTKFANPGRNCRINPYPNWILQQRDESCMLEPVESRPAALWHSCAVSISITERKTEREGTKGRMQISCCWNVPFTWVISKGTQILLAAFFVLTSGKNASLVEHSCVWVPCPLSGGSLAVGKQERCSMRSLWEDQDSVLIKVARNPCWFS